MNALNRISRRLATNDSGVTAIEYAALGALIALAIIGSLTAVGVSFERQFKTIADAFPSATPSDDDQVAQGGSPASSPAGNTGGGASGSGGQGDPGNSGSAGTPGGNPSAGGAGGGTGTGASGIPDGGTAVSGGGNPVTSGGSSAGSGGGDVNSDGKAIGGIGNGRSGSAGRGGGSGNLGRSGSARVSYGDSGGAAGGTLVSSIPESSRGTEVKTDPRATEAGRAERRAAKTSRPAQTAALAPGRVISGADGGSPPVSNPVGAGKALDPLPGRHSSAGAVDAPSGRWIVIIAVLLVLAAAFAIRRLVQRINTAGAGGGNVRSTSGARARRDGLVIAPIRRSRTR